MTDQIETTKGSALILRSCKANGESHGGFIWPKSGKVVCPDWKATNECGSGFHGLLWGHGDWSLLCRDIDALWYVCSIEEWIDIKDEHQKVKFPQCEILYCGNMAEAITMILCHAEQMKNATNTASGNSSTAASSGDYSKAASSGYYSTAASSGYSSKAASSGDSSTAASSGYSSTAASSGDYSKAASSGNYSKAASSGDYSKAASSGNSSKAASSGNYSTAASSGNYSKASASGKNTIAMVAGKNCMLMAGENGCIAGCWFDGVRNRIAIAYVGENGIEADTWYQLSDNGKWVKK